jgi:uncharacterized membrane protein YbjE (DUF340 family)
LASVIRATAIEQPSLRVVAKISFQITQDVIAIFLTPNRECDFDTTEEVSIHPVGATAVDFGLPIVLEVEHSRVFKEASDD